MTEQEARTHLRHTMTHMQKAKYCQSDCRECPYFTTEQTLVESYGVAIKALEKQIPKQVKLYIGQDMKCPSCNNRLRNYEGMRFPYCKFCGQTLER